MFIVPYNVIQELWVSIVSQARLSSGRIVWSNSLMI